MDDLRAVTAYNLACALEVIDLFESLQPHDLRPREALVAAQDFVDGGPRSRAQRICAPPAHRASKEVTGAAAHAAMAAGDASASAYLHPLADAAQVGHILRGPSFCVLALESRPVEPLTRADAVTVVLAKATPALVDVLVRYPRAASGARAELTSSRAHTVVMSHLDDQLRRGGRWMRTSVEPRSSTLNSQPSQRDDGIPVGVRRDGTEIAAGRRDAPVCAVVRAGRLSAWQTLRTYLDEHRRDCCTDR
ncbi:putative immunity protein [Phycicoccus jejuensis]|uniref:putative immunity protein n=1 Tax=Phycicoccus jejuensis TaxID=367299 RepID=UPI003CCBBDB6